MNLLITGYNGFVGSNLLRLLQGYRISGVDLSTGNNVYRHYNWNDLDKLEDIDCIIHLAGKAHDTKNISNELEYNEVNLGLTKKIFDYFLKSDAGKFIFFSSVKAVADTVAGNFLTEETVPEPLTPYGKSKLLAEQYINNQTLPEGKKVYILRPCMIHGPGNKGNLSLLYRFAQHGYPWPLGAYANYRSFLSISNLVFVLNELIEKDIPSGVYQVADDEPLSTNELIRMIAASSGRKPRIWNISPELIKALAGAGDFLRLPLNSERLKKLSESYIVSNRKIKSALGVRKMPLSASEGMKITIDSFRKKTS